MRTERLEKISNILFYIALAIELILMIVEKSDVPFNLESYVFRVTFVITLVSVLLKKHSKVEWALIAITWIFTLYCYRVSGKNELLRISTFIMAARDIDLKKTMKYMLLTMAIGFGIITLLSVTGIYGSLYSVEDFGHGSANELRYTLGFGHPNTLFSSYFAVMLVLFWSYGKNLKIWHFGLVTALIIGLYLITNSRTSLLIGIFTIVLALVARYLEFFQKSILSYILTALAVPIGCIWFSVYCAKNSYWIVYYDNTDWLKRVDDIVTNRIRNLYYGDWNRSGAFETWKLFSDRNSTQFFDMGWVRMFYWYGIIPTTLIAILILWFIYRCYRKRDIWTLLLILSLGLYTLMEATFVSRYIGRLFILPILAVYIGEVLSSRGETNAASKPLR